MNAIAPPPNRGRLFFGSCAAVIALAFSFATLSGVMFQLKSAFVLDNAQIGLIGGAGLWGMALVAGGLLLAGGRGGHARAAAPGLPGTRLAGVVLFVTATGFSTLFAAALVTAIANGVIEAVCNPLVATLYPERKAGMLNRLHLWFPGGVALGGLAVWGLDLAHAGWRAEIAIGLAPALLYAVVFLREPFPKSEAAQSGATLAGTAKAVLSTPLLWGFLLLMAVTMSLELGPNRWIPSVLESGGLPGILVLVLINGVMAVMRANAHAILSRAPPPVLLMLGTGDRGRWAPVPELFFGARRFDSLRARVRGGDRGGLADDDGLRVGAGARHGGPGPGPDGGCGLAGGGRGHDAAARPHRRRPPRRRRRRGPRAWCWRAKWSPSLHRT